MDQLTEIINKFEAPISVFVKLRNQEKSFKNTIMEYPKVMPDGSVEDGIVQLKNPPQAQEFPFGAYLQESYQSLIALTKALIGSA